MRTQARSRRGGFTLIELAIVMLIIGLIIAFITAVGFAGIEQARIRATQALITKLEMGVNERLDALLQMQVTPNGAHQYLAAIDPWGLQSPQRAQVIARIDYIRREFPDVFFVDKVELDSGGPYPVKFAGRPYSGPIATPTEDQPILPIRAGLADHYNYVLPLGNCVNRGAGGAGRLEPDEGIYGASYSARAALNKLLGYNPAGYDGADNSGDGLVDDWSEGTQGMGEIELNDLKQRLTNHRHITARSETLYAMLVEGQGPLGSVFGPDDFTNREVQDTDGDGLPEFVDAWGSPLQFYLWPIFHHAPELQKGSTRYNDAMEPRQNFPLDPNGLLTAPAWWSEGGGAARTISAKASRFQSFFVSLSDPNWGTTMPQPTAWDRSGYYGRRSFFCRFLIVSPGPDQETGLGMIPDTYIENNTPDTVSSAIILGNGLPACPTAENHAAWYNWAPAPIGEPEMLPPEESLDNIDNHGLQSQAGGIR